MTRLLTMVLVLAFAVPVGVIGQVPGLPSDDSTAPFNPVPEPVVESVYDGADTITVTIHGVGAADPNEDGVFEHAETVWLWNNFGHEYGNQETYDPTKIPAADPNDPPEGGPVTACAVKIAGPTQSNVVETTATVDATGAITYDISKAACLDKWPDFAVGDSPTAYVSADNNNQGGPAQTYFTAWNPCGAAWAAAASAGPGCGTRGLLSVGPAGDGWVAWFEFPEEARLGPNAQFDGVPLGPVLAYGPSGLTFNVHSFVDGEPESANNVATLQVDCGDLYEVLSQVGPGCAQDGNSDSFYASGSQVKETDGVVTVHFTADQLDELLVPDTPFTLAHLWSHNNIDGVSSHFSVLGQAVAPADPNLADNFDDTLWHPIPIVSLRMLEESFGCTHANAGDAGGPICDMWDGIYHVIEPQNTLTAPAAGTPADQPLVILPDANGNFVLHQRFYWMESDEDGPLQWQEHDLSDGHFPWTSLAVGGMPGVPETGYASLANGHNQEYVDRSVDIENNVVVWTVDPEAFDDAENGMTFTPDETGLGLRVTQPSHVWSGAYYKPSMGASANRVGYDQANVDACNALTVGPSNGYTNGEAVAPMGDSRTCPESGGFLSVPKQALVGSPDTVADPFPMLLDYMDLAATPVVFAVPPQPINVDLEYPADPSFVLGDLAPFIVTLDNWVPVQELTVVDDLGNAFNLQTGEGEVPFIAPSGPQGTPHQFPASYALSDAAQLVGQRTFTVTADGYSETFSEPFTVVGPTLEVSLSLPSGNHYFGETVPLTVTLGQVPALDGRPVTVTIEDGVDDTEFDIDPLTLMASTNGDVMVEVPVRYLAEHVNEEGEIEFTAVATGDGFVDSEPALATLALLPGTPTIVADNFVFDGTPSEFDIFFDLTVTPPQDTTGAVDVALALEHLGDSLPQALPESVENCLAGPVLSSEALGAPATLDIPPCLDGEEPLAGWYALEITVSGNAQLAASTTEIAFFKIVVDGDTTDGEVEILDAASRLESFIIETTDLVVGEVLTVIAEVRDPNGLADFGTLQLEIRDGTTAFAPETVTCTDILGGCDPGWDIVIQNPGVDSRAVVTYTKTLPGTLDDDLEWNVLPTIINQLEGDHLPPVYVIEPSDPPVESDTPVPASFTIANEAPSIDGTLSASEISVARPIDVQVSVDVSDVNWGAFGTATSEISAISLQLPDGWTQSGGYTDSPSSTGTGSFPDLFTVTVPEATAPGEYTLTVTVSDDETEPETASLGLVLDVLPLPTITLPDVGTLLPGETLDFSATIGTNGGELEGVVSQVLFRVTQTDDALPVTLTTNDVEGFQIAQFAIVDGVGTATASFGLPPHLDDEFSYEIEAIVVPTGLPADGESGIDSLLFGCGDGTCDNIAADAFDIEEMSPTVALKESSTQVDGATWNGVDNLVYVLPATADGDGNLAAEQRTVSFTLNVNDLNWGSGSALPSEELEGLTLTVSDGLTIVPDSVSFGTRTTEVAPDEIEVTVTVPGEAAFGDYVVSATVEDDSGNDAVTADVLTIKVEPWFELGVDDDVLGNGPGISFGAAAPGQQTSTAGDPLRLTFSGSIGAELVYLEVTDFESGSNRIPAGELTAFFYDAAGDSLLGSDESGDLGVQVQQEVGDDFGTVALAVEDIVPDLAHAFSPNGLVDVVFEFVVPEGTPSGSYTNTVTAEALQAA